MFGKFSYYSFKWRRLLRKVTWGGVSELLAAPNESQGTWKAEETVYDTEFRDLSNGEKIKLLPHTENSLESINWKYELEILEILIQKNENINIESLRCIGERSKSQEIISYSCPIAFYIWCCSATGRILNFRSGSNLLKYLSNDYLYR